MSIQINELDEDTAPASTDLVLGDADVSIPIPDLMAGAAIKYAYASLPSPATEGLLAFVSNGRKPSEGAGTGTGVLAYSDGSAWINSHDSVAVSI